MWHHIKKLQKIFEANWNNLASVKKIIAEIYILIICYKTWNKTAGIYATGNITTKIFVWIVHDCPLDFKIGIESRYRRVMIK